MTADPPPTPEAIVTSLLRRRESLGRTRLVSIDGPAGSGKTTLAARIAAAGSARDLAVEVLHLDDFYEGWSGLDLGVEPRIIEQVLAPLSVGRPARWQRYDWFEDAFRDWATFSPPDLLVLEGCGSGAREFDPYRTLLVWVEAERDERVRRGLERAGPQVLDRWLEWMTSEDRHFARNDTRSRADLVIKTD